ncbi:MAG: cytochrome c [Myxococcota bacterium]|nr:cytochrome c [Myxococcota bacterium]
MKKLFFFVASLFFCLAWTEPLSATEPLQGNAERGRLVFDQSGGCSCHTNYPDEGRDAPVLAGGRALSTPFGVYYSTNITPDEETGIGRMSDAEFITAMQEGLAPDGQNYFPIFPYTSFTGIDDQDLVDLRAYLSTLPPVQRSNKPPDAMPPFSWRWGVSLWKWLNFTPGRWQPDPARSKAWNRGDYLVNAPAHCGECHTPRDWTGGLDRSMWLAGSADGPDGELAPNITSDSRTGIGSWHFRDLVWFLETGFKPDGDDTQGLMSEVIEHGYAHLPEEDLDAIATYLESVPAIDHRVRAHSSD